MRLEFAEVSLRTSGNAGVAEITFVDPNGDFFFDRSSITDLTKLIELYGSRFQSIVLKSENPKIFSRGFDPAQFQFETKSLDDVAFGMRLGQKLVNTILRSPAKIVAQIDGLCIGAGFEFALACHQIDFGSLARVQFPEFKAGWVTGYGGIFLFANRFRVPGGIQRIINGDLIRASTLQPSDTSKNVELLEKNQRDIQHSADILKLVRAENLESSQALAIQTFLECIKRKYPERFSAERFS